MKQLFFSAALLAGLYANATIRTVSNNPSTIAQFSTIQAAVDASSSGDSVYVHGSPNLYAFFTLTNKRLVIIGPGWAPNKNLAFTARVAGCTITGSVCSRSEIQGIEFTASLTVSTNHPDSLRFIRNKFSGVTVHISEASATYKGYLFEGNVFTVHAGVAAINTSTYQDFVFQNNYFFNNFSGNTITNFFNCINVLFDHNLWFGTNNDCFSNCRFLTITNNIFVLRNAANGNSFSTFNNNITLNTANNTPWASNNNIDAGGNVANQDPQMVDQVAVNAGTDNPLLNFTIAAGPANNTGSDGKDMGLLFDVTGSLNWANSRASRLPFIFSMNITNPTIASGGTLNVQVEARKSN